MTPPRFIPGTRVIEIERGVVYRPIVSWHAGNLAGMRMRDVMGDRSGCVELVNGREMTSIPKSVIHRHYWHPSQPDRVVSAFLSYPYGLGAVDHFFWECSWGDVERFETEEEMERAIVGWLAPN
jgi:hypothetical protein